MDFKPFAGLTQEDSFRNNFKRLLRATSTLINSLGQMRVSVDNVPSINTVATVTAVTTVGTVNAVTNNVAAGGYLLSLDQLNACRSGRAGIRSRIS